MGLVPFKDRSMTDQRAEFGGVEGNNSRRPRTGGRCADSFQIAPTTGYKWLQRYAAEASGGVARTARGGRTAVRLQTAPAIEQAVLALRTATSSTWGPRKLRVLLARQGIQPLPAASTDHGHPAPPRPAGPHSRGPASRGPGSGSSTPIAKTALWQMDFKAGWPSVANAALPSADDPGRPLRH